MKILFSSSFDKVVCLEVHYNNVLNLISKTFRHCLLILKYSCAACLSDEFQCNDGKCLKSSSRCDGHQDCHDADDEMGCVTVDNQHIVSTYEPYSGTWGLLCAEDWNPDDGQYLCQELGFG